MGIYGIGIDVVMIDRVRQSMDRWGARFVRKVFTEEEEKECRERADPASCLALRFAAKEAFAKAIGTGISGPVGWRDVHVALGPMGNPQLRLSQRLRDFCHKKGIVRWHVSLSDDGDIGVAMVVLETGEP